jgi:hypothetical protein
VIKSSPCSGSENIAIMCDHTTTRSGLVIAATGSSLATFGSKSPGLRKHNPTTAASHS